MGGGDGLGSGPGDVELRDDSADRRDLAADVRDDQANLRDGVALAADSAERPSSHLPAGRGWERRSAQGRQLAAGDRVNSAMDRRQAAEDRASARERVAHEAIDPLTGAMRHQAGLSADDDIVMRIGGGGFVCSLVRQNMDQADRRYARISARLAGRSNGARMTVGLAARQAGDTLETLIDRADQVMLGQIFNGRLDAP